MMACSPLILTVLLVLTVSTVVKSDDDIICTEMRYDECLIQYPFMPNEKHLDIPSFGHETLGKYFCTRNYFRFKLISDEIRMGCFTVERLWLEGLQKSFDYACVSNVDFTYEVFPSNCTLQKESEGCSDELMKYYIALKDMIEFGISKKYRREHADQFCEAVDALKECQEIFYDGHCTDAENVKKWMSDMHDLRHEPLLSELSCLDTVLETWLIICILIAAVFMIFIMVICVCSMRSADEDNKTLIE